MFVHCFSLGSLLRLSFGVHWNKRQVARERQYLQERQRNSCRRGGTITESKLTRNILDFDYLQEICVRSEKWEKNSIHNQKGIKRFSTCDDEFKRPYLITTENVEYSYALLKILRAKRSFHRCVVDGISDL